MGGKGTKRYLKAW